MFGYFKKNKHRFFNPTSYYDEDIKYIASKFKFDDNSYSSDIGHSSLATYKNTIKNIFLALNLPQIYMKFFKRIRFISKKLLKHKIFLFISRKINGIKNRSS